MAREQSSYLFDNNTNRGKTEQERKLNILNSFFVLYISLSS